MSGTGFERIDPTREEWMVIRLDAAQPNGFEPHAGDGGKTRFDLPTATRIQMERGRDWQVLHYHTMVNPKEHDLWLRGAGRMWAP